MVQGVGTDFVVVMMNLLIGSAVSDISIVRQEAEIYSCQSQVEITSELVICGDSVVLLQLLNVNMQKRSELTVL